MDGEGRERIGERKEYHTFWCNVHQKEMKTLWKRMRLSRLEDIYDDASLRVLIKFLRVLLQSVQFIITNLAVVTDFLYATKISVKVTQSHFFLIKSGFKKAGET